MIFNKKLISSVFLSLCLVLINSLHPAQAKSAAWQQLTGQYAKVEFSAPYLSLAQNILFLADQEIPRLAQIHGLDSTALNQLPKARIILTDKPDVSNGFALGNTFVIYALSSMYMLYWAEEASWYYTVLTHELAHWVSFKALQRKLNKLGMVANITVPRWFYEGIAQYCAESWNLYRGEQSLRQAVIYGDLNYEALNNLDNGRLLYASANGFIRFLVKQYGDSSLVRLFAYKKNGWYFDFDEAFKAIYKKSAKTLFREFIRHSVLYYGSYLSRLPEHSFPEVFANGLMDDPKQIVWLSQRDSLVLVAGREKSHHRFVTLKLIRIHQGKIQSEKVLTNNLGTRIIVSPDRRLLAFGRPTYQIEADQLDLRFEWQIIDLKTIETVKIQGAYRARYGAFDFRNRLYLVEVLPTGSQIHRWSMKDGMQKGFLLFENRAVGPITFNAKNELFMIAEKEGRRSLLRWQNAHLDSLLTGGMLLDLKMLNSKYLAINLVKDDHLEIEIFDSSEKKSVGRLVDQFEYYFSDVDSPNRQLLTYRFEGDGLRHFYSIPFDSLLHFGKPNFSKNRYGLWQSQAPVTRDSLFARKRFNFKKKKFKLSQKRFPFFPLENVLTAALPFFDPAVGWGFSGITAWIEALQRQMLIGAFYIMPQNLDKSFYTLTHNLRIFNSELITGIYHGPVIFAFKDQEWFYLVQENYYLMLKKYLFPFKGSRWKLTAAARYQYFKHRFVEKQQAYPSTFRYQGPGLAMNLIYDLPSIRGLAFPVRYFNFQAQIFKTVRSDYSFKIIEGDLTWGSELFFDQLGLWQRLTYLRQSGHLPPLKTVGLDRFYKLEIPRDYTYTRTVRGFNEDRLTNQLWWSSTELRYLIDERTSYKLLFIPVNLLSVDTFFDYARLGSKRNSEVSSFGLQISMGEKTARFSAGLARSFIDWQAGKTSYYLRLEVLLGNTVYGIQ